MKRWLSLLLIVILALGVVACSSGDDSSTSSSEGEGSKVLRVTKNADLNNMDPQVATDGLSFEAIAAVTDGLLTLDESGAAVPALAETFDVSDDGMMYTFHLRDAKWSNGEPVVAADFVYAWQRLASAELASEYSYMIDVSGVKNGAAVLAGEKETSELGVKAQDDKTLVVELERPIAYFDTLMAFPSFYPVNEAFVKEQGDQYGLSPETTLYNGAFLWTEWFSGNSFSFTKNPDYWDADNVKLDGIEFKVALDAQSAVLDFESGNSDYTQLRGELVDKYKDQEGYEIELGSYLWWLQPNFYGEKFQNQNLLKAIALSYNRDQVTNNVLKDGAIPAYFFVPRKLSALEGEDFVDSVGEFFTEGKEKGKEYWEAYKKEANVQTLEFELLFEDSEQSKKVAEFLKSEIESNLEGMTVSLKGVPKKTRLEIMRGSEEDYDIGLTRWGPDYADPMTYLELYAKTPTDLGRGGYSDAKYDELIELAKSGSQSKEERWATLVEAHKLLLETNVGPLPVYQTGAAQLWNPKVKGVINNSVGVPFLYKNATIED